MKQVNNVVNNGHTIQFNYQPGSSITIGGKRYDLLQFHFHSPSENTVDGQPYPLEMHLVHKSADGRLAVVGVFFQAGRDSGGHGGDGNDSLANVFGALPGKSGLTLTGNADINAADLLPRDRGYYHFMGSLTTPPCSEGVGWFVMRSPLEISPKQLARFQTIFDNNARPVQPWNKRILFSKETSGGAAPSAGGGHGGAPSGGGGHGGASNGGGGH